MTTTILFAAITALVLCFVASLIEDFVLPHRSRRPQQHLNPSEPSSSKKE